MKGWWWPWASSSRLTPGLLAEAPYTRYSYGLGSRRHGGSQSELSFSTSSSDWCLVPKLGASFFFFFFLFERKLVYTIYNDFDFSNQLNFVLIVLSFIRIQLIRNKIHQGRVQFDEFQQMYKLCNHYHNHDIGPSITPQISLVVNPLLHFLTLYDR